MFIHGHPILKSLNKRSLQQSTFNRFFGVTEMQFDTLSFKGLCLQETSATDVQNCIFEFDTLKD